MKHSHYVDLRQISERCDHPEDCVTESAADPMGHFSFYCKKCNTSFSRYDYALMCDERKRNSKLPSESEYCGISGCLKKDGKV
jgi:hypothetical protein